MDLLDFETFRRYQNSFHLHFVGEPGTHLIGDIYRSQRAYQRCLAADMDGRFAAIAAALTRDYRVDLLDSLEFQKRLYDAYVLIRPFAETDQELFR